MKVAILSLLVSLLFLNTMSADDTHGQEYIDPQGFLMKNYYVDVHGYNSNTYDLLIPDNWGYFNHGMEKYNIWNGSAEMEILFAPDGVTKLGLRCKWTAEEGPFYDNWHGHVCVLFWLKCYKR